VNQIAPNFVNLNAELRIPLFPVPVARLEEQPIKDGGADRGVNRGHYGVCSHAVDGLDLVGMKCDYLRWS